MTVVNSTLAEGGRRTMAKKVSTTALMSMQGSGFMLPSGWGTPFAMAAVMSEATLPMSIWPTAIAKARPSSEAALVSPLMACLVAA